MDLCPVEKNKEYIMSVTDIGNDGEGIGHIEGFAVFVKDALPGEKIRVKITKANKKLAYGRLMEIIEHSEYRTEPECPVFKRCGGAVCSIYLMRPNWILRQKKLKTLL